MQEVVFGRYTLLSLIGQGGMGRVYRARDTTIGRDVALKLLPPEVGTDPAYRERFRREAHTAARLTEPHIIPIYDTGDIDGQLYLVMPIIEGIDVQGLIGRDGPLDPARAVHIIEQLASALDAAHSQGLVHRDIKPSNALLTEQDFVYLIDFGVARGATATKLTSTGVFMGTLAYMAPERFIDGVADARSDIYALACVLHECLTANTPYAGDSMEQQIAGHLTMDPPQPTRSRAALPAGFDRVIATGMAKDPDQRYATAGELASAARAALTTAMSQAPVTAPHSRANPTGPARTPNLSTNQQDSDIGPLPATDDLVSEPVPRPGPHVTAGPVIVAAVTIAILTIGTAAYLSRPHRHPPDNAITQSIESPAPPTPAVTSTALQGLLLNPDQLDTATGTTTMTVTGTLTTLPDGSDQVPDKTCVPLEGAGQATIYADSGYNAVSGQRAADQTHAHLVEQIVVSFPSAQEAQAFYTNSAQRWQACAGRPHDETTPAGQTETHTVGPVSNTNGTLSATITGILARNGSSEACERALTVANNVAIDIAACGENPSGTAVSIADQIATKVPVTH